MVGLLAGLLKASVGQTMLCLAVFTVSHQAFFSCTLSMIFNNMLAGLAVRSIMQAGKYLFRHESKTRPDEGEKACESPPLPPSACPTCKY